MNTVDVNPPLAQCGTCGAEIFWARYHASNKRSPIDFEPAEDGNVVVIGTSDDGLPLVHTLHAVERAESADAVKYKNHWATCTRPPQRRAKRK